MFVSNASSPARPVSQPILTLANLVLLGMSSTEILVWLSALYHPAHIFKTVLMPSICQVLLSFVLFASKDIPKLMEAVPLVLSVASPAHQPVLLHASPVHQAII